MINNRRKKSSYRSYEYYEQKALINWTKTCGLHEVKLLFAIPNGGVRDIITATTLKASGVKPGVPDLFLPVAKGPYHGLFIEMKRADVRGRLTQPQAQWISALKEQGYKAIVCHGWIEAAQALTEYLQLR